MIIVTRVSSGMALKESYEDQNPGGQFLKKYQPHENVLEYLSYGQHKSFCLSRRHHARVRTREVNVLLYASSIPLTAITQLKKEK